MKTRYYFLVLFLSCSFGITAQNTCSPENTAALITYYPFCGNANDESGNGNHGTIYGASLCADRFGNTASAYSFNGVSDHINIPELTSYSALSFSVSLWLTNEQTNSGLLALYHGAASGEWAVYKDGMGVHLNDGNWYSASFPSIDSTWKHFVGVYNRGHYIRIYLDGQLAAQDTIPDYDMFTAGGYFSSIGSYNQGALNFWQGKIDDVYIYNRELNATEIDSIYHQGGWVGVREIANDKPYHVFPNCSSGKFRIAFEKAVRYPEIRIYNSQGRLVYSSNQMDQVAEIDLSKLAGGIYFMIVSLDSGFWSEKLIIN